MDSHFYMQIICLGMLVLAAHFGGKITRYFRIGEVVGQVLGGLVVGPVLLFVIEHKFPASGYREALTNLHFFTFIFLSIIAFGIGDELSIGNLKKIGKDVFIICITQALATWLLIAATFYLLGFSKINSLLIGSIGIATAPAVTFVIMNKLDIVGRMRSMLGGIVVLDDVIEVIFFSVFCQIAIFLGKGKSPSLSSLAVPIFLEFFFAILIAFAIFVCLRWLVERRWLQPKEGSDRTVHGPEFLSRLISEMPGPSLEIFVLVAGFVCLGIGIAMHFELPFLVTAVVAGMLIANFYSREVFHALRIENATTLYTLVFFALIGANANLDAFHWGNLKYVAAYIIARGAGKVGGTWFGCKITRQDKRLTSCLPKLMLPQAGVAAVEAYYIAEILPGGDGKQILSIILPGLIVFEIMGVLISERALLKWRSWMTGGGELIGEEERIKNQLEKEKLSLKDFLKEENLRVPLEVNSKGETIWELIRTLQSVGEIRNPGEILEIIIERERQGGTALGEGIVLLHGRLPDISEPRIALGVIPQDREINFGGLGDVPVHIVFIVLSPKDNPALHLQVLAAIANFLSNKDTRIALEKAENESEAINIIKEYS